MISLPDATDAAAAGRIAELEAVAATLGRPLPPLYRQERATGPFRIVYLMPRTGAGGGARVLFEHANHLSDLGASVAVLSHFACPEWIELKARFVEVPFGCPLWHSIPPCDVIVAGYWDEVLPARLLGIAPVVHFEQGDFHLYDDVPADLKALVAASLGAADWTITVGEAAESALAQRYGVFAHRIANAVDGRLFHRGSRSSPRSVLFVGWDGTAFKGLDVARHVADGLRTSHPELRIVWVTPSQPVGALFGETVVAPPQDELARRMREASVYVGTSRYESFPLPPLEAMASGTPVVSTANEGVLAYARDGENCLLAPVDDVDALLAATRRVLDDSDLAQSLERGGMHTAASLSWPAIAAELMENLRSLADELPPSPASIAKVRVDDLVFEREHDRSTLFELVAACPYVQFAIPVSQPAFGEFRVVRWQVVATKRHGVPGVGRAYLPARSGARVEDAPHQFAIDLLREGFADAAFSWLIGQCQMSSPGVQAVLGRWVLVALLAAGRPDEAVELATVFASAHPANPDYYCLRALAGIDAHRPVDLESTNEVIRTLGVGGHFEEWFERPAKILAHRVARDR